MDDDNDENLDDIEIDEGELERELANLKPTSSNHDDDDGIDDYHVSSKQIKSEAPPPPQSKQTNNSNSSRNNNTRLKGLEMNLNAFNKKYNQAVSSNDTTKIRRFKRILDVSMPKRQTNKTSDLRFVLYKAF